MIIAFPVEVGATWRSEAQCHAEGGSGRFTLEARVTGREQAAVGDEQVEVLVIESQRTHEDGADTIRTTRTDWFAPTMGIHVRSVVRFEGQNAVLEERLRPQG